MNNVAYAKIDKNKTLFSNTSLWEAYDHLLYCENIAFRESYKRFQYSDIQGIIVTKDNRVHIMSGILLAGFVTFFLMWYALEQPVVVLVIWIVFALGVVVNLVKGDTCTTYIQTAVQQTKLGTLSRIKKVDRFLDRIRPLIQSNQGTLDLQIMAEKYGSMNVNPDFTTDSTQDSAPVTDSDIKGFQDSPWHLATFQLLIIMGVVEAFDYHINHMAITILSSILIMVFTIVGIIAIVKHSQLKIKPAVKNIMWITLGFGCLMYIVGYGISMYVYATAGEDGNTDLYGGQSTLAYYRIITEISPDDNPFIKIVSLGYLYGSFLLGSLGLFAYFGGKRSDAK